MAGQPLSILHLTAGSDAGGLSRYIHDLCAVMHREGHQVAVAGERGAWHWLFQDAPWPWIDAPLKGGPVDLWRAAGLLSDYLREHRVDVIHTHYRRPTLVARVVQRRHRVPILYSVHLSGMSLRGPRRWLSDFGDHTHVASREAFRWVTEAGGVPADRVTVIPHGIQAGHFPFAHEKDRRRARATLQLPVGSRVAAFVGRLDDPKNEGWMLDLADRTRGTLPDLKVILAGEGPHQQCLARRVVEERLTDRVFLLGHRDPLLVYQSADALLLPSAREGFSYVCAEAMAAGVPVLRTRTAGTEELIIENVTGRSVPVDREAFLAAAAEFLADSTSLGRMGQSAAQHVRQHFPFERQVEQTLALYRSVAQPSGRS